MEIYVVKPGDSVDAIAAESGVLASSIAYTNQLVYPYRLAPGQALLLVPEGERPGGNRRIFTNGYAYPFLSPWTLRQTLPYLSELSVFSYGFTGEGELVPPEAPDAWMAEEALAAGTSPILTLTPLGPDGRFNSYLVSLLVHQPSVQQKLLGALIGEMRAKGYQGLNFDFEYIKAEDRDAYTALVERTTRTLNLLGYSVSVALAPKTFDDQPGLLYEGMDYRGLGQAANWVFLMTYEWGYTYGPPMAVAPIDQVRRVVEYAVSRIPPDRISLGIPNYGYDWPLPFVRGETRARTLGNVEAVQQAIFYGVPIRFDNQAQSPYYRYWQYGVEHEVWFEDVRSYSAKADLIDEYGLRGLGVWQIMQLFRGGWQFFDHRFQIE